jgi:DNA-binding NarL/FixJ family response regulator
MSKLQITGNPQELQDALAGTNLLIADDHDLIRETLACFLIQKTGAHVVQSRNLDDTLENIRNDGPFDLVLLDLTMPGMTMPDGLRKCLAANDPRPVAILTGSTSTEIEQRCLMDGATGFFPKSLTPDEMVGRIRSILSGTYTPATALDANGTEADSKGVGTPLLTQRERDVLTRLCEGKSNREIAQALEVQEVTVKLHVKTLSRKLNARNRTHAALLARDLHLI